jgi:5-methylcytosine-specific restriction endonuclease McrA
VRYACVVCGAISDQWRCPKHRYREGGRPGGSSSKWRRLREQVWARDNGVCQICREPIVDISQMDADHVLERHLGGEDALENLRATHGRNSTENCNGRRERPTPTEAHTYQCPPPPPPESKGFPRLA